MSLEMDNFDQVEFQPISTRQISNKFNEEQEEYTTIW
jgi:hypothetical protein